MGFIPWTSGIGLFAKKAIISYALNTVTAKIFGPKPPAHQSPTYTFMRTQANSSLPVPIIYGKKVRAYGNKIWQTEGSTVNAVVCFGQGKIKGFSNVRINNIPIGDLPGCSYTAYLGDGVQEIDSRVPGQTQRDKAMVIGGLKYDAYLALTIKASDKVNGDFTVSADIDGKIVRIYSDINTYTEDSSENPVWNMLDFYINRNACGVGIERLLLQTFINEAAYCNQLINGKPRFTLNLALDDCKARGDWLTDMMATCRCHPLYQNGRYGVFIEKPTAVSQIFNVKKTEEFKIFFAKNKDIVDKVNVRFVDPTNEWTKVPSSAEVPKNKRRIKRKKPLQKNVDIWGVTNFEQASRLAWFYANESATSTMFAYYRTNRKASNRTAMDVIATNDPVFQLQGKQWWVTEVGFDENGYVAMLLREYNVDLYGDQLGSAQPVVNVTTLTNPYATPPDATNLTMDQSYYRLKDGTVVSYISGTFTPPNYRYLADIVVDVSEDAGGWIEVAKVGAEGVFTIPNAKTGVTYMVRIRVKNRAGIYSSGIISAPIYVTGKDSPPSDVTGLTLEFANEQITLTINKPDDPDIHHFELREGLYWDSATPIDVFGALRHIFPATKNGNITYLVKSADNSGNQSNNPAIASINIYGLKEPNIIVEHKMTPDLFTPQNMAIINGQAQIVAVEKLTDYNTFASMFGGNIHLKEGAEITLPVIDLGGEIIDANNFYVDSQGIMHSQSIETLSNYSTFASMFGGNVTPKTITSKTDTKINISVLGNINGQSRITRLYRSSLDGQIWDNYKEFAGNDGFFGRHLQVKLLVSSLDRKTNTGIERVDIAVDVPDVVEIRDGIVIPAAKTKISWQKRFINIKSVSVIATDTNGLTCSSRITGVTTKECYVELLDKDLLPIAGNIGQIITRGY